MLRRSTAALAAAAAVATAALSVPAPAGAAGAGSGNTTGITPTSVTIGQVDTLSGPVPGLFLGAKDGTQAYLDYINSKGGVNGRKLYLKADDDQFSAANYATETQSLVGSVFALVGGFSLFDASGVPAINAAKIPDVTVSLSAQRNLDQYNFSPNPLIPGGTRLGPFKYYKSAYGNAYKSVGTIDSDVATAEAQSNADFAAMKSLGYNIVYKDTVSAVQTDFTPDVLKMKSAGVQMVYIVGLAVPQVADLAKDMAQQNFKPKLFSTNGVAYDSSYIPTAGQPANGTHTDQQSAMYLGQDASSVPAVATFDKWIKKVNPSGHIDTYGLFGWLSAQLFAQALQTAGKNPTRASVLAALDKITSFNGDGLIATTNPAQKKPGTCWIEIQVTNGSWQRTAPSPKSGFICNPGGYYIPRSYHFTRQPPPAS